VDVKHRATSPARQRAASGRLSCARSNTSARACTAEDWYSKSGASGGGCEKKSLGKRRRNLLSSFAFDSPRAWRADDCTFIMSEEHPPQSGTLLLLAGEVVKWGFAMLVRSERIPRKCSCYAL
jgi:hypothetical protein